jgi:hypothetical protein
MLEAVDVEFSLLESAGGAGGARGDALWAALYAGGCGG